MELILISEERLREIIQETVSGAISGKANTPIEYSTPIRGIRNLAKHLNLGVSKVQRLKNDGVIPYFQDDRTVLFDPKAVHEALRVYNSRRQEKALWKRVV